MLSELLQERARVFDRWHGGWCHLAVLRGRHYRRVRAKAAYIPSHAGNPVLASPEAPWVAQSVPGKGLVLRSKTTWWFGIPAKTPLVRAHRRASLSGLVQIVHRSNASRIGRRCCQFRKHLTRQSEFARCQEKLAFKGAPPQICSQTQLLRNDTTSLRRRHLPDLDAI